MNTAVRVCRSLRTGTHDLAAHMPAGAVMIAGGLQSSATIKGALMVLSAMLLIGLIDNFVRIVAEHSGVWQFHLFRSMMACPLIVLYCLSTGKRIRPKRPIVVMLRSLILTAGLVCYFVSLSLLPIATAGAGLFTSPLFLVLFSVAFFGSSVGVWRIAAVIVGFSGVLMVLQPDPSALGPTTFLPVLAGALYAVAQLITRHFLADENTSTVLLWFFLMFGIIGLVGTMAMTAINVPAAWLEAAPFFFSGWRAPTAEFLFWTTIQALGSLVAVSGLIRGYQIADPTYIGVFEYSFLLSAGLWSWMLWNEIPNAVGMVGIAAIIAAGALISVRTSMMALGRNR